MKLLALVIGFSVFVTGQVLANDVEPRLYSNVPTGINFVSIGYANSQGEVTFDSSVPVEDADGKINSLVLSYSRGLNIAGKSALLTIAIPYADIELTSLLLGEPASGRRPGFGDPRIRLSMNFYGASATTLEQFATYEQKTIIGGSISIGMPFGRYLDDKLLNVGANRWNMVGQVGVSHRINRLTLESAIGVSIHSDNDEVVGDRQLEQDPIALARGTILYHFPSGKWLGAGFVYINGGDTTLDGNQRDDHQENWRAGLAFSMPLAPRPRVTFKVTEGISSRIGADFRTYGASYTYTF